jgi:hypothetical protein
MLQISTKKEHSESASHNIEEDTYAMYLSGSTMGTVNSRKLCPGNNMFPYKQCTMR